MNTTDTAKTAPFEASRPSSPAPAAKPASSSSSPNYDSGLRYGSGVRYAADPTLPVNDGGIIKFSPSTMKAGELPVFAQSENTAITGNPLYPSPVPSVADVAAAIATVQSDTESWKQVQIALRDASTKLDGSTAILETLMKTRASYVQSASNGNTNAIVSAGFLVRSAPTPVGNLSAPVNLLLSLNGTPGMMYLEWSPVINARGYNIQMAPADTLAREWQPIRTCTGTKQMFEGMELGKVYAFRISAVGGASGSSPWSAEVVRMAA
jgi:hypothetical protein